MIRIVLIITLLASFVRDTRPFSLGPSYQLIHSHRLSSKSSLSARLEEDDAGYPSDVDWDAEWKKVVASKDQPDERPGKDFYKSDVEKAAIKATREVQERVIDVRKTIAEKNVETPDMRSLQGDGRFWIAILVIISVGIALVGASSQQAYSNDSFYI
uniref:Uncharacterized protein n=1 Tax=Eucampia antarctica TaxID=49252 RepID=A0A6U0TQL6_9STRA|mmetsp:Transcript_6522/g.6125  ORF Transcript_6522/g.6125 Transcript_6522/m.6125 type:complete len:157 (+) Transcript_6522:50-520(+)|eukprot:CAMPEP_0197829110 /NCGR_PEP_ID=MMETSP1437-20131217/5570_1 /TAXON_ID=49252 ORGANISM="Eucampia antarctica, Strain CCMP1452" /NCGR_SAMPLE_ID=MMETSP1437 /ASSEMBLY_ACC=CAM_ASM_001096 /LENGTH=156 /DNA_ID=CAMNT_0043430609 /DNA_START=49 /DNA_END=519 /DNA_ORIENTATION=-